MVLLGVVVDPLHVLDARQLLVEERRLRRDLAAREARAGRWAAPGSARSRPAGGTAPRLSWSSLRSSRVPFLRMMFVNASSWRRPLFWSLMLEVAGRAPAQAHDLVHRRDALRAHLDAAEAVRAVVDAVRVLGEVAQALLVWASRGSPTKRYAFASAAGPMNSGSTSSDRQSDTHAPQWMQAIDCVTSIIDSGGTTYSRSGGSPCREQPRHDPLDLLPVDRVHVHDQVLQHRHVAHRLDDDRAVVRLRGRSLSLVLHASFACPLTRTPHDPQIAAWHEQRIPIEPSSRSLACRIPSSTRAVPLEVDLVVLPSRGRRPSRARGGGF